MKIVTMTAALSAFGLKEAIKIIKESGFDAYDCTLGEAMIRRDDYLEVAKELRAYADSINFPCAQTHSVSVGLRKESQLEDNLYLERRSIEFSAILGAEIVVAHPAHYLDAKGNYDEFYSKLLPLAKDLGIKIATENMYIGKFNEENVWQTYPGRCGTSEDFVKFIDTVNDESFTACLDIGHAHMIHCEGAPSIIRALGHNRLKALHVHDNDCIHDDHLFPFLGKIDWDEVCRALAEIDYTGNITFEADNTMFALPKEVRPHAARMLAEIGKHLRNKIDAYKSEI